MRKVILDLAVTLDGFIEGPNGEIDWCIMDDDIQFDQFLSSIDTIFYGRKSYELWGNYQPDKNANSMEVGLYDAIHSKNKYVFSTTKSTDNSKAVFIKDDIEVKVKEIKSKPGRNIWLYGGASLIKTFIELNLVDEYRLAVHPIILGTGKPLFFELNRRIGIRLTQVNTSKSGVVQLCYEQV
jgi:dihydrofolate reductase